MLTTGVAAWVAHVAFWVLLGAGVARGDLGRASAITLALLWCAGLWALAYVPYGSALFPSFVALLDIALVLVVAKGDVRL